MNPFLLPPDERLANWKAFRRSLMTKTDEHKFSDVAAYWAQAPLMTIAYDLDHAEHWPTPWEMVYANEWCRNSVAIGMEATLRLVEVEATRMKLRHIIDRDIQAMLLVLVVDSTWVLNYSWGSVLPYPKTNHQIIREWHFTGKTYCSDG